MNADTPLELEAIAARDDLEQVLRHLINARDFTGSAETKRGLSIAITNVETALLWLRASVE